MAIFFIGDLPAAQSAVQGFGRHHPPQVVLVLRMSEVAKKKGGCSTMFYTFLHISTVLQLKAPLARCDTPCVELSSPIDASGPRGAHVGQPHVGEVVEDLAATLRIQCFDIMTIGCLMMMFDDDVLT